jgi:hypothetical protein
MPMNCRKVNVTLVDGRVLSGSMNIGNSRRVSDHLNRMDLPFVILFDVVLNGDVGLKGRDEEKVVFVNKQHIVLAVPASDQCACHREETGPEFLTLESVD